MIRLPELTRRYLSRRGDPRPVRGVPAALPALTEGALLAPEHADVVGPSVDAWLRTVD